MWFYLTNINYELCFFSLNLISGICFMIFSILVLSELKSAVFTKRYLKC